MSLKLISNELRKIASELEKEESPRLAASAIQEIKTFATQLMSKMNKLRPPDDDPLFEFRSPEKGGDLRIVGATADALGGTVLELKQGDAPNSVRILETDSDKMGFNPRGGSFDEGDLVNVSDIKRRLQWFYDVWESDLKGDTPEVFDPGKFPV